MAAPAESSSTARVLVVEDGGPRPSTWAATVTLLNCAVGAGVLSFPFAFSCTGWLTGLVLTLLAAVAEAFTLYVLARYAEYTNSSSYSDLVRKMLGRSAALFMSLVIFVYIWGSAAAYLLILGDSWQPLLATALGEAWYTGRDVVIAAVSCTLILPLCFPRTLTALAGVSALTLWGLFVVVGAVVLRSVQLLRAAVDPWAGVAAFSPGLQFFSALPIFVFGFQCHTNVIAVFDELPRDLPALFGGGAGAIAARPLGIGATALAGDVGAVSGLPSEAATCPEQQEGRAGLPPSPRARGGSMRRPKSPRLMEMVRVVMAAIGITSFFYCCIGAFGYLAFAGAGVHSNILTNFAPGDRVMQVARAVVGVIQIASYPVMHNPARAAMHDLLFQLSGLSLGGAGFNIVETLAFFCSTLFVSLLVTDLGTVFRLVGGTGGGILIFGLPGLLLMQYAHSKHVASTRQGPLQPLLLPGDSEGGAAAEAGAEGCHPGQPRTALTGVDKHPAAPTLSRGPGQGEVYSYWRSKVWWSGVALVLLNAALFGLTLYTVFWAPAAQT